MKNINKNFFYNSILLIVIVLIIFLLPYLMGEDTFFWDFIFVVLCVPIFIFAEAIVLFIYGIISPSKILSIRIFRWAQGMIAIFSLLYFTMFCLDILDLNAWLVIMMLVFLVIIISLWIAEFSVRLVIKHRNKKSIQEAE